jgi:hypothetical protein
MISHVLYQDGQSSSVPLSNAPKNCARCVGLIMYLRVQDLRALSPVALFREFNLDMSLLIVITFQY